MTVSSDVIESITLTKEKRLEIFGSPDCLVFLDSLLSDGDSVYSTENQFEILGTPEKTWSICKTCWNFGSCNDFKFDLLRLWCLLWLSLDRFQIFFHSSPRSYPPRFHRSPRTYRSRLEILAVVKILSPISSVCGLLWLSLDRIQKSLHRSPRTYWSRFLGNPQNFHRSPPSVVSIMIIILIN